MKTMNPYGKQKNIQLVMAAIGAVGMVIGLYFFFGNSDNSFLISSAMYPFFIASGVYQYFQFKKKYIRFSEDKIEWDFITNENPRSILLSNKNTEIVRNWKGALIKNGDQEFEISLDGIWKKDRNLILNELEKYYQAA